MSTGVGAERLATLRAVAGAATPGPWALSGWDPKLLITERWAQEEQDPDGRGAWMAVQACWENDAAFVAAFDPPTTLALLDEVETLRTQAASIRPCARCGTRKVVHVPGRMVCCDTCAVLTADEVWGERLAAVRALADQPHVPDPVSAVGISVNEGYRLALRDLRAALGGADTTEATS